MVLSEFVTSVASAFDLSGPANDTASLANTLSFSPLSQTSRTRSVRRPAPVSSSPAPPVRRKAPLFSRFPKLRNLLSISTSKAVRRVVAGPSTPAPPPLPSLDVSIPAEPPLVSYLSMDTYERDPPAFISHPFSTSVLSISPSAAHYWTRENSFSSSEGDYGVWNQHPYSTSSSASAPRHSDCESVPQTPASSVFPRTPATQSFGHAVKISPSEESLGSPQGVDPFAKGRVQIVRRSQGLYSPSIAPSLSPSVDSSRFHASCSGVSMPASIDLTPSSSSVINTHQPKITSRPVSRRHSATPPQTTKCSRSKSFKRFSLTDFPPPPTPPSRSLPLYPHSSTGTFGPTRRGSPLHRREISSLPAQTAVYATPSPPSKQKFRRRGSPFPLASGSFSEQSILSASRATVSSLATTDEEEPQDYDESDPSAEGGDSLTSSVWWADSDSEPDDTDDDDDSELADRQSNRHSCSSDTVNAKNLWQNRRLASRIRKVSKSRPRPAAAVTHLQSRWSSSEEDLEPENTQNFYSARSSAVCSSSSLRT